MSEAESHPLPAPPPSKMSASHKALAGLLALLILSKLAEMIFHAARPDRQGVVALFYWKSVLFFVALALLGSGFAHIVGFPGMWEERIRVRGKIWLPLGAGVLLGAALLLVVHHSSEFARLYAGSAGVLSPAVPIPLAILFETFRVACAAIFFTLFPLAFAVWLIGTLILARRWPSPTFWVFAVLLSCLEPVSIASHGNWAQIPLAQVSGWIVTGLLLVYAMDLIAAIFLRRFGFTAALVLRLSAVTVWHLAGRL